MAYVWSNGPTDSTQRFVLLALADSASDDGGNAYPSIGTLAKKCALSDRTVIRALDGLVADGYLTRQRRKDTSNMYQIVLSKLVSDKMTHTNVTERHSTGDTLSLTDMTDCHGTGDTVSHDPSFKHPIKHQGNGRATPPTVVYQSTDRTPAGFKAQYGYHPPTETPQPDERKPDPAIGDMTNAITEVTGIAAKLNKEVFELAVVLVELGYSADQMRRAYSKSPTPGAWHWYAEHWKGKRGDRPSLKDIRETIAAATEKKTAAKKLSQLDILLGGAS